MKRFNDGDSDRYHTAIAAGVFCALLAGTFMLGAAMALRLDLTTPAYYFGGLLLVVVVVQAAGWVRWGDTYRWFRNKSWRNPEKSTFSYRWKKTPLPPPDQVRPSRRADSTFQPHGAGDDWGEV